MDDTLKDKNDKDWELLTSSKRWYIQNICSLNTLEREYKALKYFNRIAPKLKEIILRPDEHAREIEKKFRVP